jgi:hypothetical protein
MLPQLRFPLPPTISTTFSPIHHRIHCAKSLVIAETMFLFLFPPNLFIRPMPRPTTTISRQVNEATIVAPPASPSHPTTPSEIGDDSQAPMAALQDRTSPRPTDASSPGTVAAALQNIPPAATLSPRRKCTAGYSRRTRQY